jgi:hypothetical protein
MVAEEISPIWVSSSGKAVCVKDMSSNHIFNAIRCWTGRGGATIPPHYLGGRDRWLKIFEDELKLRLKNYIYK